MSARDTIGKWPIAGYAPGNYHCKCADCEATFEGDKRAIQCLPCALTASGYRILGPDEIARLTAQIAQLRHAYTHLNAERVIHQREFANGLIHPAIAALEDALCATHQGDK